MAETLTAFKAAAEVYARWPSGYGPADSNVREAYYARLPTAKQILRTLDPTLHFREGYPREAVRASTMGLGILADWDDVAAKLQPDSPTMRADALHPWVWDVARTFWESRHWRVAVQTAATAVNARTQTKVGRTDITDSDLMAQVFSLEPPKPGKPRLRFPGDRDSPTWTSRQAGALNFGQGCFMGLRNPATHEDEDWEEQVALESLAALSVLARWINECDVETAEGGEVSD
ncbi:MAG TPA: TIGR02391 family protein [Gemmatimonadaceae bacterium]